MAKRNRVVSFGLTPTPPGVHPWGVFGGTTTDGTDADKGLDDLVKRGGNQNPTNTCVWWAIVQALYVRLGAMGLPQKWASILAGYYATRMRSHNGDKTKIHDLVGCRPPDAAMVVREVGLVPDAMWPFVPSQVDAEPPWDVIVAGDDDWFCLRRIIVPDGDRGKAVRHIIHDLRTPVLIGQEVNQEYIDWEPGDMPWTLPLGGPVKGRHMELIATYNRVGPKTVSSWGDWYDRQMAWKQVESDSVSDLWYPVIDREKALRVFGGVW